MRWVRPSKQTRGELVSNDMNDNSSIFRRRQPAVRKPLIAMALGVVAGLVANIAVAASAPTDTLVIGLPTLGTERWDVQTLNSGVEQQVMDMVNETLLTRDPKTLELRPGLAKSWALSRDGKTWVFKLHDGVPWQKGPDGTDYGILTSDDVRFTWSLMLEKGCTATRCAAWRQAVGGNLANFEVVSNTEFRIHTPTIQPLLPQELANGQVVPVIVSKKYFEKAGYEAAISHPVGTGPFRFLKAERGFQVTLEAVPKHWRQTASFTNIILRSVPDDASRLAQVMSGGLDLAPIAVTQRPQAEAAGLRLISIAGVGTSSIMLGGMYPNHPNYDRKAPWIQADNPKAGLAIRQAMSAAIDRKAILDKILFGEGELMAAPLSFLPGAQLPWNEPSWKPDSYDPNRARKLLSEGGYPNGFTVSMPIFEQGGRPAAKDIAEAVAGMFERVGITVKRMPMDFATFRTHIKNRTTTGMVWQFTAPGTAEPALGLIAAYMPDGTIAHMYHPAITENVPKIYTESNSKRRMELTQAMGRSLLRDVAALPVVSVNTVYVASARLGNWTAILGNGYVSRIEYATRPGTQRSVKPTK